MTNSLDRQYARQYYCCYELRNSTTKRLHTVIRDFFTSVGLFMGAMGQQYNTRKGKTARLLCEVSNIVPAQLRNWFKSHKGVKDHG